MHADQESGISCGSHNLRVGDWLVDQSSSRIIAGDTSIKLEPRAMDVLVFLAQKAGQVVTREELETAIWAGRVVSYEALSSTILKLRKALKDNARQPHYIETVSKRGYRLIATVSPVVEQEAESKVNPTAAVAKADKTHRFTVILATFIILILALVALFLFTESLDKTVDTASQNPVTNTIAVLPFDNLGKDPEQEYFADGMTDDLITELAQNPNLFVIARDSTFLYKNDPIDIIALAKKLRVRYILRGSVRKTGDKLRINVQLIDTTTGSHLWAERYDGETGDILALQDTITRKIFTALAIKLHPGDMDDNPNHNNFNSSAYDYFLHGRNHFFRYANKEENLKARALYLQALELDPNFASAYAMLAWTYVFEAMNGWSDNREQSLETSLNLSSKATALDPKLPIAYFVSGLAYREQGKHSEARTEAEKALKLEPSYANAHVLLATLLYYDGKPQEGLHLIQRAMRLNPHHPYNYPFHLGQAYFILKQYQEAINAFEQGLSSNPSSERMRVWLAATYAQSGRIDDARWEADQVITIDPTFSLERIRQAFPFKEPADLERFIEGLRMAGLTHQ